jgi:hypothetical protein
VGRTSCEDDESNAALAEGGFLSDSMGIADLDSRGTNDLVAQQSDHDQNPWVSSQAIFQEMW